MQSFVSLALRLAAKSSHPKYKMAAVVIKGGNVLNHACNTGTWHEHAERQALKNLPLKKTHNATLLIARLGGRMSKPCDACMAAIKCAGIRKIVYQNWSKETVTQKV